MADVPPVDIQPCLETFLVITKWRGATVIQWAKARDTVKCLIMHRTAPRNKELCGPTTLAKRRV